MSKPLTAALLADLIPLHGLREALREALLPYGRLRELKSDGALEVNAATQAAWVIRGAVDVRHTDGSSRLRQASIATHLPVAAPDAGTVTLSTAASAAVIVMDRRRIDTVLTWTELYPDGERPDSWLFPVLRSELLTRLPAVNVQNLLRSAHARDLGAGEAIINQGDRGNDYYLLLSGTCEVLRESSSGLPLLIAQLQPGDSFGEEALLTDGTRNASVHAGDDGATVLVIARTAFDQLIHQPLLRVLAASDVAAPSDALVVDVRSAEEFAHGAQTGARNLPLPDIRDAMSSLPKDRLIAVTCDTGRRATAAAFLLAESGFDVGVLRPPRTASDEPELDQPDTTDDDLQDVLDDTYIAFEEALGEAAELEVQVDAETADAQLRQRLDEAMAELEQLQQRRASLERKLRDRDSERERLASALREQRDALHTETEQNIASERGRIEELYAQAEARVQELEATRLQLRIEADREHARIDVTLDHEEQRLSDEAASVRREFATEQTRSENRERELLEEKAAREAALAAECEAELKRSRRQLETSLAQSVDQLEHAQARLDAIERERARAAERARQSAGRLDERRAARRAERTQAVDDKQDATAQQRAAVVEEALRRERDEAIASALRDPTPQSPAVDDAHARELEEMGRQQRARANAVEEERAEHDLMSDVRKQLGSEEAAAHAERETRPANDDTRTGDAGEPERHSSRDALARARAHLERLRAQSSRQPGDGDDDINEDS